MESTYRQGFTIDMFLGLGLGYRRFVKDDAFAYIFENKLPQGPVAIVPRFGLNFAYNFSFGRWK